LSKLSLSLLSSDVPHMNDCRHVRFLSPLSSVFCHSCLVVDSHTADHSLMSSVHLSTAASIYCPTYNLVLLPFQDCCTSLQHDCSNPYFCGVVCLSVCLSVVCQIRAPCLNCSTDSDGIWKIILWGPITHCVSVRCDPRRLGEEDIWRSNPRHNMQFQIAAATWQTKSGFAFYQITSPKSAI